MFQELTDEQRRIFIDTTQVWDALEQARRGSPGTRVSMWWRKTKGREYLIRRVNKSEKSLGPRNAETEAAMDGFKRSRQRYREMLDAIDGQARFAKAARLDRVPLPVAELCRLLADEDRWRLVGTQCLYAYEARAGVRITSDAIATQDADVLWDSRGTPDATLVSLAREPGGLLGLLRQYDDSFEIIDGYPYRVANSRGFMVDLIRPFDGPMLADTERRASKNSDDMLAQPIEGLEWLASSPLMEEVVIDSKGVPVRMVVPDPRAFAVHKLWLSTRDDREPTKRQRDRNQALLVAKLLREYLVTLPLDPADLKQFPADVCEASLLELQAAV